MGQALIISVSGLRGIIGENLTAALAADYGCAFGSYLRSSCDDSRKRLSVCLGRDSRPSGPMIQAAVTAGLCSVGVDVTDLGIVTTPCVGVMLRELACDGGAVITASHNPIQYNGVKLLLSDGIAPPPEVAAEIKARFQDKDFSLVGSAQCGRRLDNDQADPIHIDRVLAIVRPEEIAARRFKVVLDSVNGAGGRIGLRLLEALGCEVIPLNGEPTGFFAHEPEPTEANLQGLCDIVRGEGADIGFAQDPDADRIAIVDQNGRYLGEEYTLALAAKYVLGTEGGNTAANLSTSRMLDDIAEQAGVTVIRTPVGEANVAKALLEHQCIVGGEGNGGIIDLRVGPVRDSLVAMALVLQLMATEDQTVGQLADQIGGYAMLKEKFSATAEQADRIIAEAKALFPDAKVNTSDGCRFEFSNSWIHLRLSNTEPVMRVIVEAPDQAAAEDYARQVGTLRDQVLGQVT